MESTMDNKTVIIGKLTIENYELTIEAELMKQTISDLDRELTCKSILLVEAEADCKRVHAALEEFKEERKIAKSGLVKL